MLDPVLLNILCCPETHQDFVEATSVQVDSINTAIAGGKITNRGGQPVTTPVQGALIRQDRAWIYVVRDEIPVMLIDEAIPGAALPGL